MQNPTSDQARPDEAGGQPVAPRRRTLWLWLGWLAGPLALIWVLREFDLDRLRSVLANADNRFLLGLPFLVAFEQLIRAFKWRQLLICLRPVGVWRLFGAIMVGYLSNYVAPVRVSPLVRAWVVSRLEEMRIGTVLASIALDRIIDGFVFVIFTVVALVFVRFPNETGIVREGLVWGAAGSLVGFSGLVAAMVFLRHLAAHGAILPKSLTRRLPHRLTRPIDTFATLFAQGVVVPHQTWRRLLIVASAVAMKLMAALYFVLAGLAFGVVLDPMAYLFVMVFLGFLVILAGMLRIVGSFTVGAVFVLRGFGVEVETALAMAIIVQMASFGTLAVTGAVALWVEGVGLGEMRAAGRR